MTKPKYKNPVYTDKDLENIATALNGLVDATNGHALLHINTSFFRDYYSEKKYIDFEEKNKLFASYDKYDGWEA